MDKFAKENVILGSLSVLATILAGIIFFIPWTVVIATMVIR